MILPGGYYRDWREDKANLTDLDVLCSTCETAVLLVRAIGKMEEREGGRIGERKAKRAGTAKMARTSRQGTLLRLFFRAISSLEVDSLRFSLFSFLRSFLCFSLGLLRAKARRQRNLGMVGTMSRRKVMNPALDHVQRFSIGVGKWFAAANDVLDSGILRRGRLCRRARGCLRCRRNSESHFRHF